MSEPMKIALLGGNYVGKTTLATRFCEGRFPLNTIVTIGAHVYSKSINIEGDPIKILDTASQERFMYSTVIWHCQDVHALVFIYDITDPLSLNAVESWIEECKINVKNFSETLTVLVGTKCDLEHERRVEISDARRIANDNGMEVFEITSKLDSGSEAIESIFHNLADKYRNKKILEYLKNDHLYIFGGIF